MLQNIYFCAPNPQSQAYIQYQGINFYPMNLIYAPSSPSYFLMSDFQENLSHQLFYENTFQGIDQQNKQSHTQKLFSESQQTNKKVKIQTNGLLSLGQANENNIIFIKTEQIQGNQNQFFNKNIKMNSQKLQKIKKQKYFNSILKQQRKFFTRKRTQRTKEVPKTIKSQCWKQTDEKIQLDGIELVKKISKELIIQILNNQDSTCEALESVKNHFSGLISQILNKQKENIQQSLDLAVKILSTKNSRFKKTKEEIIKYIFRRIYNTKNKPNEMTEYNWKLAQKIHKKNSSTFKSMNLKFVEKQFQNPIFSGLFSLFIENFQSYFEKENEDRIDRLNFILASAFITEDMTELRSYKKLPWNKSILRSVQRLFEELKEIQRKTRQSDIKTQFLVEEYQLQMDEKDSSLKKKQDPILFRSNTNQSEL